MIHIHLHVRALVLSQILGAAVGITCTRPAYTAGYNILGESELDTVKGFAVAVVCATGYIGNAHSACTSEGSYTLSGCSPQFSLGWNHACAIVNVGSSVEIKCWGQNTYGQLGDGGTENRGDQPGEMFDALPSVDLGTARYAIRVACGFRHTCVILDNTDLKCWGWGQYGQIGSGAIDNLGDNPGEMGDALQPIALGTQRYAVFVATGGRHTCTILDNTDLKCFGWGEHGRSCRTLDNSN